MNRNPRDLESKIIGAYEFSLYLNSYKNPSRPPPQSNTLALPLSPAG